MLLHPCPQPTQFNSKPQKDSIFPTRRSNKGTYFRFQLVLSFDPGPTRAMLLEATTKIEAPMSKEAEIEIRRRKKKTNRCEVCPSNSRDPKPRRDHHPRL